MATKAKAYPALRKVADRGGLSRLLEVATSKAGSLSLVVDDPAKLVLDNPVHCALPAHIAHKSACNEVGHLNQRFTPRAGDVDATEARFEDPQAQGLRRKRIETELEIPAQARRGPDALNNRAQSLWLAGRNRSQNKVL